MTSPVSPALSGRSSVDSLSGEIPPSSPHPSLVEIGSSSPIDNAQHAVHLQAQPSLTLRKKAGPIQAFIYGKAGEGGVDMVRPYEEFNQKHTKALSEIYHKIEEDFKKEGFEVVTVWPRSGKVDVVRLSDGQATFFLLDTQKDVVKELRGLFQQEKWKTDDWYRRGEGERGDRNGPDLLIRNTARLHQLNFTDIQKKALEKAKNPEDKVDALRKLHWVDSFQTWMQNHVRKKIHGCDQDPAKARLKKQYEKLEAQLVSIDSYAVKSAVSVKDRAQRTELVQSHISSLRGPVTEGLKNKALGLVRLNEYQSTDDKLSKSEEEYIQDIALLDVEGARAYHQNAPSLKRDNFAYLLCRLVGLIEKGGHATSLVDHPAVAEFTLGLPASDQIEFKEAIKAFIEEMQKQKPNLTADQFDLTKPELLETEFAKKVGKSQSANLAALSQKV